MLASSLTGAQLYSVAQQVGQAATTLLRYDHLLDADLVISALAPLAGSGLLTTHELARFQKTFQDSSRHFSSTSAQLFLSRLEGRILGELVRSRRLPDEARWIFEDRLAGRIPATEPDIREANRRIRVPWLSGFMRHLGLQPVGYPRHVKRTRLKPFPALSEILGRMVFLKLESGQPVGSFKNRGSTNFLVHALLTGKDPKQIRVGAASHGNHAQGVVRAAHNLGIRQVEVLLPRNASPLKIAQLKALGAAVELFSETFEEAEDEVRQRAARDANYLFLPAFDHPLVVTGQGTAGIEISLQMAAQGIERYAVVSPTGGGGLIAGIAESLGRRGVKIFGAESETHPYISRSFHAKKIVSPPEIRHVDTVADGIALLRIGHAGFASLLKHVAHVVTLPEHEVEAGLMFLKEHGIDAEGAAAVPIAALLFGALPFRRYGVPDDLPVVSVLSGKNIDEGLLKEVEERSRRRTWADRRSEFEGLQGALKAGGFLRNGEIRALADFEDAKSFLDLLVEHLPDGWDPIDALSRLHFGPWRPEGEKDINATLRSMGAFQERWEGNKGLSVVHPLNDRATRMVAGMDVVRRGKKTLEAAEKSLGLLNVYPRLLVETYIIDLLLKRGDWLRHLWPEKEGDDLAYHAAQLRRDNQKIQSALAEYARLRAERAFSFENRS